MNQLQILGIKIAISEIKKKFIEWTMQKRISDYENVLSMKTC